MNSLVKAIKRMFDSGKLTKEQIKVLYQTKKITKKEYDYIIRS